MNKYLIFLLALYSSICFSDKWIDNAKNITTEHELTSIALSCIEFEKSTKHDGQLILITTFEIHSKTCLGDPETRPKLFFIEFDLRSKTIKSNALSDVGQMIMIGNIHQ